MALLDVYRLSRTVILDGIRTVNVMHFQDTVGTFTPGTEENELMDAFDPVSGAIPDVNTRMIQLQRGYETVTPVGLTVQRIQPTLGFEVGRGFNKTWNPVDRLTGLPQFSQLKLTFFSDLPGRSGRGGIYLAGIAEAQVLASTPEAALNTAAQNLVDAFIDAFTAPGPQFIGFTLGVFSRLLLEYHNLTSMSFASTVGTMRSRRVGVGA